MKILDPCCGGKMFWFDKENPDVIFGDIRSEKHTLCDGRKFNIEPEVILDYMFLPFEDGYFDMVVYDPPHLIQGGKGGWQIIKYGKLNDWEKEISGGFSECFRVLKHDGVLIFKWNETQLTVSKLLKLTTHKPLFGHKSGKLNKTHWITFCKF